MSKIILSYTTINNLHEASHTWICKQMGITTPETDAMRAGKEAHKRLQDHAMGKKMIPELNLPMNFPKSEHHARRTHGDYILHGFLDGVNFASKSGLEIKTSKKTVWSQQKFHESMQPKYYSFVTGFRNWYFISCRFDLSGLVVYHTTFTDEDWKKAEAWAQEGIDIIEKGDFKGGLDEHGHCTGCSYGSNCYFL